MSGAIHFPQAQPEAPTGPSNAPVARSSVQSRRARECLSELPSRALHRPVARDDSRPVVGSWQEEKEPTSRELPLGRGYVAIVDAADYDHLSQWRWCAQVLRHKARNGLPQVYAQRSCRIDGRKGTVSLHRAVLSVGAGLHIDHINGIGLDCRRANLRPATRSQNCSNSRRATGPSGYIGVRLPKAGRWVACIKHERVAIHLGRFDTAEDAARAYDAIALKLKGAFAVLNFPDEAAT